VTVSSTAPALASMAPSTASPRCDASKTCLRRLPEWKRIRRASLGLGSRSQAREAHTETPEASEGAGAGALATFAVCEPRCVGTLVQLGVALSRQRLNEPGLHRSTRFDSGLYVTVPSRLL
jgi:hypothetical protein